MLGMLKEAFGRDMITRCLRIATKLHVFFSNILGRTAHFDVGAVRFIGTGERIWTLTAASTAPATTTVTATHALVLMIGSHRTIFFSIIIHDG